MHPHLVLLGVPDEFSLTVATARLKSHGIGYRQFIEPDRNNELTSVVTALMGSRDPRRKALRRYACLRPKSDIESDSIFAKSNSDLSQNNN